MFVFSSDKSYFYYSDIREQIQIVQNKLKQLYNESQLQRVRRIDFSNQKMIFSQIRYSLHAVCVHEGSATLGHFWTYVYHTDRQKWYRYNDNEGKQFP